MYMLCWCGQYMIIITEEVLTFMFTLTSDMYERQYKMSLCRMKSLLGAVFTKLAHSESDAGTQSSKSHRSR